MIKSAANSWINYSSADASDYDILTTAFNNWADNVVGTKDSMDVMRQTINYNTNTTSPYNSSHDKAALTVYGDMEVKGNIKLPLVHPSRLELDENDIIVLSFPPGKYSLDEMQQIFHMWVENFPNHQIITNYNDVQIDIIHAEKPQNPKEVSW